MRWASPCCASDPTAMPTCAARSTRWRGCWASRPTARGAGRASSARWRPPRHGCRRRVRGQRVYFEVGGGPYAAGTRSFIGETLTRLGMANIVPADARAVPQAQPRIRGARQARHRHGPARAHRPRWLQRPGWDRLARGARAAAVRLRRRRLRRAGPARPAPGRGGRAGGRLPRAPGTSPRGQRPGQHDDDSSAPRASAPTAPTAARAGAHAGLDAARRHRARPRRRPGHRIGGFSLGTLWADLRSDDAGADPRPDPRAAHARRRAGRARCSAWPARWRRGCSAIRWPTPTCWAARRAPAWASCWCWPPRRSAAARISLATVRLDRAGRASSARPSSARWCGVALTLALARGALQTLRLLLAGVVVGVVLGAVARPGDGRVARRPARHAGLHARQHRLPRLAGAGA